MLRYGSLNFSARENWYTSWYHRGTVDWWTRYSTYDAYIPLRWCGAGRRRYHSRLDSCGRTLRSTCAKGCSGNCSVQRNRAFSRSGRFDNNYRSRSNRKSRSWILYYRPYDAGGGIQGRYSRSETGSCEIQRISLSYPGNACWSRNQRVWWCDCNRRFDARTCNFWNPSWSPRDCSARWCCENWCQIDRRPYQSSEFDGYCWRISHIRIHRERY